MKKLENIQIFKWGTYDKYEDKNMFKNKISFNKLYRGKFTNTTCGDWCEINIATIEPKISNIIFSHKGCLLSKAAINALLSTIEDKTKEEALNILFCFRQMIEKSIPSPHLPDQLNSFCKFCKFSSRKECLLLGCNEILQELNGTKQIS